MTGDYPTRSELRRVAAWPDDDFHGWMAYIHDLWHYADWGWSQWRGRYRISTGGWSGNEEIIEAMQRHLVLWTLYWWSSRRGGHYEFRDPRREPRRKAQRDHA